MPNRPTWEEQASEILATNQEENPAMPYYVDMSANSPIPRYIRPSDTDYNSRMIRSAAENENSLWKKFETKQAAIDAINAMPITYWSSKGGPEIHIARDGTPYYEALKEGSYGGKLKCFATREEALAYRGRPIFVVDIFHRSIVEVFGSRENYNKTNAALKFPRFKFAASFEKANALLPPLPPRFVLQSNGWYAHHGELHGALSPYALSRNVIRALKAYRERYPSGIPSGFAVIHANYSGTNINFRDNLSMLQQRVWDAWSRRQPPRRQRSHLELRRDFMRMFVQRINGLCGMTALLVCDQCGIAISHRLEAAEGFRVCGNCADSMLSCPTCHQAGSQHMYFPGQMSRDLLTGVYYCAAHAPAPGQIPRDRLLEYSFNIVSFKPKDQKFLLGKDERQKSIWLGFELEVMPKADPRNETRKPNFMKAIGVVADHKHYIAKRDGSVSSGLEVVSIPASLQWHRENSLAMVAELGKFTEGWNWDNCGMHVHIGKAELSELALAKMVAFCNADKHSEFLDHVAGRHSNQYCQRRSKILLSRAKAEDENGRYRVMNLANDHGTVECRMFRSNVAPLGFFKNLEFCDALAHWAKTEAPNSLFGKQTFGREGENYYENCVPSFLAFVAKNRASYPIFVRWLEQRRYLVSPHKIVNPKNPVDYIAAVA